MKATLSDALELHEELHVVGDSLVDVAEEVVEDASDVESEGEEEEIAETELDEEPTDATDLEPVEPEAPQEPRPSAVLHFNLAISELRRKVSDLCLEEVQIAEELKQIKARRKLATEELQSLVNRGPEYHPLFDNQPQQHPMQILADATDQAYAENRPPVAEASTDEQQETQPESEADDESWQDISLADTEIPDKILEKLYEAKLETVGDLAAFGAKNQLTDIKGIGAAKATQIEDAMANFWASRSPVPAGMTSTTTPAGIAMHDPDARVAAEEAAECDGQGVA